MLLPHDRIHALGQVFNLVRPKDAWRAGFVFVLSAPRSCIFLNNADSIHLRMAREVEREDIQRVDISGVLQRELGGRESLIDASARISE